MADDPVFEALCALLQDAAKEILQPEQLPRAVIDKLRGTPPQAVEAAARRAAQTFPTSTGEGFLLRLLPQALRGPISDAIQQERDTA